MARAPAAVDDPVTEYVPSARPGNRAPHVWLRRGNEQISTIDLFGPRFVLLAGSRGDAWLRAAQAIEHVVAAARGPYDRRGQ